MRRYILVNLSALFVLSNAVVLIASVTKAKVDGRRGNCHIMSLHNLSLMYKGFLSFAQDNEERFPWQLATRGVRQHIDARATYQQRFGEQVNRNVNLVKMIQYLLLVVLQATH